MKTADETAWRLNPANAMKGNALAKMVRRSILGKIRNIKLLKIKVFTHMTQSIDMLFLFPSSKMQNNGE